MYGHSYSCACVHFTSVPWTNHEMSDLGRPDFIRQSTNHDLGRSAFRTIYSTISWTMAISIADLVNAVNSLLNTTHGLFMQHELACSGFLLSDLNTFFTIWQLWKWKLKINSIYFLNTNLLSFIGFVCLYIFRLVWKYDTK